MLTETCAQSRVHRRCLDIFKEARLDHVSAKLTSRRSQSLAQNSFFNAVSVSVIHRHIDQTKRGLRRLAACEIEWRDSQLCLILVDEIVKPP